VHLNNVLLSQANTNKQPNTP